jgi:hypothetical protein
MEISSSAFPDQGKIGKQYVMPGAGGKNTSIPYAWTNPPAGVKSFALSVIDPHPIANNWVHWLVINIPPETNSLAAGASGKLMPAGALELANSFGATGYGGPQPPKGSGDHPYVATLYALDAAQIDLPSPASLKAFQNALKGKVLATATITGFFGR